MNTIDPTPTSSFTYRAAKPPSTALTLATLLALPLLLHTFAHAYFPYDRLASGHVALDLVLCLAVALAGKLALDRVLYSHELLLDDLSLMLDLGPFQRACVHVRTRELARFEVNDRRLRAITHDGRVLALPMRGDHAKLAVELNARLDRWRAQRAPYRSIAELAREPRPGRVIMNSPRRLAVGLFVLCFTALFVVILGHEIAMRWHDHGAAHVRTWSPIVHLTACFAALVVGLSLIGDGAHLELEGPELVVRGGPVFRRSVRISTAAIARFELAWGGRRERPGLVVVTTLGRYIELPFRLPPGRASEQLRTLEAQLGHS